MNDDTTAPDDHGSGDPLEDASLSYAERLERAEAARAAREAARAERQRRAEDAAASPAPRPDRPTRGTSRPAAAGRRQGPRKVTVAMAALLALGALVLGAVLGMVAAGRGGDPGMTTLQREVQVVTAVPGR